MKYILAEDVERFSFAIAKAIEQLGSGVTRIELAIDVGEDEPVADLVGYWVGDLMRLDIKFRS